MPFRPRPTVTRLARCEVVTVAGDLLALLEQLEDVSARAAAMGRPALEVERTVQHLLDAVSAVERALDCIGEGEQSAPG
ncbi:protein of unassigned function [Methylobacterium oryzae CBMB20]|uniref:Protein of unassigned function n=1 Tax=Methylobacterium oryzae CBMB20 TaxID=693986 RepID=A0A089Q0D0_9HYPH|nr:protein of unassigned function [Methylobacterium oryzae CBMB20]